MGLQANPILPSARTGQASKVALGAQPVRVVPVATGGLQEIAYNPQGLDPLGLIPDDD